jgi:hypothetical protein
MDKDLNTPAWQLTTGELINFIIGAIRPKQPEQPAITECNDKYVYHISGIAKLLGCSKTTVYEYRKQGWIEPAIKQMGRNIVCDAQLALNLFGENKEKKYVCSKSKETN